MSKKQIELSDATTWYQFGFPTISIPRNRGPVYTHKYLHCELQPNRFSYFSGMVTINILH